jgi:hypothetical protein
MLLLRRRRDERIIDGLLPEIVKKNVDWKNDLGLA